MTNGQRKFVFLPAREFEALIDEFEDVRDHISSESVDLIYLDPPFWALLCPQNGVVQALS